MTACVNNQNKEGAAKRAVSATLAGVLAVGMVPAVALAAPAEEAAGDDGIQELLAGDQAAAFSNGYISKINLGSGALSLNKDGDISAGADQGKTPYVVASGNPVVVTGVEVTVDGVAVAVTKGITVSFQDANGNPVAAIIDPGKYYVVATGNAGTDYAGASVKVAIEVRPAALTNAYPYIVNPDDADDTRKNSNFAFSGSALNFGFAIPAGASPAASDPTLKAGKDYTVQFYNRDTNTVVSSVVNKGTYYAVLTGLGMYNGAKWATGSFEVKPFNLTGATVVAPDFTGAYPTQPTSIVNAGNELNPNQVILVPSQGEQDLDTPGQKNFDVVPTTAAADSGNVVNSATATAYKVGTMASFQYHGSALPSTVTVDLSKKETFALNDIVATYTNAAGKVVTLEQGFAGTYDTDSPVVLEVKGTNGTTNPMPPTGSAGWTPLNAGTYEVTATVNPAACGSKAGGSQTIAVKVINSSVDADANGYITYDSKAFTSLEKVYNGSTGYAVSDFGAVLTNADGSAIATSDYNLEIKDAQGNKVTAAKLTDAGTYTLTIVSNKYNVTGNATATFTITPLDLTKPVIYKDATTPGTPDKDSNDKVIPLVTNNGAGYEYIDTTKSANPTFSEYAPFVNTGTADDPVYVEVGSSTKTPGINLAWQVLNEKNEWVPAATTPVADEIKSYRLVILCNEQDAGNYKLASGNETILSYVGIPKDEFKFIDVLPGEWYFVTAYDVTDAITGTYETTDAAGKKVTNNIYLMNGTSNTTFAPNAVMTRAMAAGVMCNMSGSNPLTLKDTTTFSDVPTDAWFAKAVSWAQETGTVNGKSATTFAPDENVTREQFMAMLSNYAKHTGMYKAVDTDAVLGQKADGSSVSDWARECVAWGVANKIIGKGDAAINPQGSMTRAEAASMAMAYWTGIAGQAI